MSSPIGSRSSSPIPSTSTQEPLSQEDVAKKNLLSITLLVQDLLGFSSKRPLSRAMKDCMGSEHRNLIACKVTSDQLKAIAKETAKSASEIAAAVTSNQIQLKEKLWSNNFLSHQELTAIKSSLMGVQQPEDVISSKTGAIPTPLQSLIQSTYSVRGVHPTSTIESPATPPQPEKKSQHHLPIKKQKYRWEKLITHEPPAPKEMPPVSCSLSMLTVVLEHIHKNRQSKIYSPFECPQKHQEHSCDECLPLLELIEDAALSNLHPTVWQLEVLLQHTSPSLLALIIHQHPPILQKVLTREHIKDHQLAILIQECNIPDTIYSQRVKKPEGAITKFYEVMDDIIFQSLNAPLTKTVLEIWKKNCFFRNTSKTTKILLPGDRIELCDDKTLAKKVPLIERFYPRTKFVDRSVRKTHVKYNMTLNFARFVAKVTLDTLFFLQNLSRDDSSFFTETPQGKLPSLALVEQIFALVLLSCEKQTFFAPSCKASAPQLSQQITFSNDTKKVLTDALNNFILKNEIKLAGSHP